jgi:hypothetical protein
MAINFPNNSRSYDATRRAVRFWGYDRSMESSFFVTADALKQMQPNLRSDAVDLLRAFDINRDRIYAIAAKVYARGRRGSYDLNVTDVCPALRFNNNQGTHMSKEPKNLVLKNQEPKNQDPMSQEPKAQEIMLQDTKKPTNLRANAVPFDGYVLSVDGKLKTRYENAKDANAAGAKLKQSYPVIQVAVYDAAERNYRPVE